MIWVVPIVCALIKIGFFDYQSIDKSFLFLENNIYGKAVAIGTIRIKMFDCVVKSWTNARHVLEC